MLWLSFPNPTDKPSMYDFVLLLVMDAIFWDLMCKSINREKDMEMEVKNKVFQVSWRLVMSTFY